MKLTASIRASLAALALGGVIAACLAGCAPGLSNVSFDPNFAPGNVMRVAVLDFDWTPPAGQVTAGHTMINMPNAGKFVADSVSARLLTIRRLEVLERSKIAQLLAEKDATQAQLVSQGRYEEIGQFLGVDYLVVGTVNAYTTGVTGIFSAHVVSFSCRCVEVKTSKLVWALSGKEENMGLDPARGLDMILDDAMPKLKRSLAAAGDRKKP